MTGVCMHCKSVLDDEHRFICDTCGEAVLYRAISDKQKEEYARRKREEEEADDEDD